MLNKFFIISIVCLFAACKQKASYGPEAWVEWAKEKDNTVKEEKQVSDYTFKVVYKPCEYMALKETEMYDYNTDSVQKIINELKGMQYYTFTIVSEKANELMAAGAGSDQDYSARLQYFSGDMQNDIYMVQGIDTMTCVLFHYERNYGLAPSNVFSLGFDLPKSVEKNKERLFIYDDKILGTGKVQIAIAEEDITNTPTLKLN